MTSGIRSPGRRAMRDACAKTSGSFAAERQEWRSRRFERWQRVEAQRSLRAVALLAEKADFAGACRLHAMDARHEAIAKRWGML